MCAVCLCMIFTICPGVPTFFLPYRIVCRQVVNEDNASELYGSLLPLPFKQVHINQLQNHLLGVISALVIFQCRAQFLLLLFECIQVCISETPRIFTNFYPQNPAAI